MCLPALRYLETSVGIGNALLHLETSDNMIVDARLQPKRRTVYSQQDRMAVVLNAKYDPCGQRMPLDVLLSVPCPPGSPWVEEI